MSTENRVLWARPEDCLCGAKLRGTELEDGTNGPLRLTREVRIECPRHGMAEAMLEDAITAAEGVMASVPGLPPISRPQLRRMVLGALPVVEAAVRAGTFPATPGWTDGGTQEPNPAPTEPTP